MNNFWRAAQALAVLVWLLPSVANAANKDGVSADDIATMCNAAMNLCVDACNRQFEAQSNNPNTTVSDVLGNSGCVDRCINLNTSCNGEAARSSPRKKSLKDKMKLKSP